MADAITKFTVCNNGSSLDHYEVTFTIDPAGFPCTFSVLPSEMSDPTDHAEVKTLACAKASIQKVQETLTRIDDSSMIGPVSL
jgi:hypothetical protein